MQFECVCIPIQHSHIRALRVFFFFSGKKVTTPQSPRVPVCLCSEVYERHLLLCTLFTFLAAGRAVIPDYEQAIQSKQKGVGRFRSVLHEAGKAWTGPKIAAAESKESPKEKAWVIVDSSIWYTQKSWQTPRQTVVHECKFACLPSPSQPHVQFWKLVASREIKDLG